MGVRSAAIGGGAGAFRSAPMRGGAFRSAAFVPGAAVGTRAFRGSFAAIPGGTFRHGFHSGTFRHGFHGGHFHRRAFPVGAFAVGLGLGYGAYGYPYYDYASYGCYLLPRRVLTPWGWRIRRVQVCDW
jgi:hypothetical protein